MPEYTLNKAQKQAVEYTDGPLLIVAGAGTGKTSVITRKICYLIEKKLALPEEILALTFTDKTAAEMAERTEQMINSAYSELQISTFHSFCQRILEDHAIDIGLSNQFKMLTETAAWLLVRKNFHKFKLDYYRPLGNPTRHIHELLKHFSKCKDELITPADYLEYAENQAKDNGDINIDEKNRLTEIANAYHDYNQLLIDKALLDFGDLIFYSIKLLSERPKILEKLQKKYKYILVDEFQDVNWAQYKLVRLLAGDQANLTVVGDDDQSIYAFRGASVSNILRFKDDFPTAKEIVLNENYRSGQKILDTAYQSIQHNNPDRLETKLNIDKKLKNNTSPDQSAVVHLHASNLEEETRLVVEEIKRLKTADESTVWDDFAILVRANSHAEPFITELQNQGISYEFLSSTGLYRQPIVINCINFLKILVDHRESAAIYRLLSLKFLNLKINDLHTLTHAAKKKSLSLYSLLKSPESYGVSTEGSEMCRKLLKAIDNGMIVSKDKKPYQILVNFLDEIGYFKYILAGEENGDETLIRSLGHLNEFLKYIKEFETISPDAKVADFLEHFTMVVESGDKGSLYQPSDTPDSVNILTAHASKGLEFKYVFVVNLVEDRFPARSKGDGIEIPPELIKEQLPEGDSHLQEERRLFYVAVTRAKSRVYFTSAANYGGVRAKKISRFLNELGYVVNAVTPEKLSIIPKTNVSEPQKTEFDYELPRVFSFSQIRSYETCPYQYKLAHILKIPTCGNASFSFGQTIHGTLQAFYGRVKELNQSEQTSLFSPPTEARVGDEIKVPNENELLALYEKHWIADWYKDQRQREEYYDKGKKILSIFYKSQEDNWTIPVNLESWFKIKVGDYLMHGRIDRIDQMPDGTLEIIDYKTGKSKEKLTGEDKEQLLVYQIAAEELPEYKNIGRPGKLTFHYVNDNLKTSFLGKPEELADLKEKLIGVIDKIREKNFTATPGKFVCENCDFKDICDFKV